MVVWALHLVLDLAQMSRHLTARHAAVDEGGSRRGLGLVDVSSTEQELAIEVAGVDGVHVDHVNGREPGERQAFEDVAAKAPSAAVRKEEGRTRE